MRQKPYLAELEWARYAEKCIDPKPVRFVLGGSAETPEGYAISRAKGGHGSVVAASAPRGLLYGAYALIDACRQRGGHFADIEANESPAFPLRMLWSWGRLDNTYLHSPFLSLPSLLSHANIGDPESNAEVMRFVRHMASMRVNALALTYDLHLGALPAQNQYAYRPYYASLGRFARFLGEWGVGLYLYANAAPEREFRQNGRETDCPFDPVFEKFWRAHMAEIAAELPELEGFILAAGLGGVVGGQLHQCDCGHCRGKTPLDRVWGQIQILSGLLGEQGRRLVYDLTTDLPHRLCREVEVVLALADRMPENAILTFKNHFQDYEELRYPEHPVFSRLEDFPRGKRPRGKFPGMAPQMQLFPEMRGKGLILSNVADIWHDEIRRLRALGAGGLVGVVETHPDDAHPSMAEWHVWGRLAWNPDQSPQNLLAEWTRLNYPEGVDAILPDVLRGSCMAASNILYAGGLQCAAHGMLCPSPGFLRRAMTETWYRSDDAIPFDTLGVDDEPLDLYTERRRREIEAHPRLFLLTKARRLTPELHDRLMAEKDAGVAQYEALLAQWRTAAPLFAPDDYRYGALLGMLERNAGDARRFRSCLSLFWRYHMGKLTADELRKAGAGLLNSGAACSINTCDESVALFLDRLRMLLEGVPFDARFNNMTDLPQIAEPGWEEGAVMPNRANLKTEN